MTDRRPPCMFSVDVEEWFHVERFRGLIPRAVWGAQRSRVEPALERLLALLAARGARATFFVLGWLAERRPDLVRRLSGAGHEVACHGFHHEPLTTLTPAAFLEDAGRAKALLEDVTGQPVRGYRAPTFSLTPWAVPLLGELGFAYDSSYFPGPYRYPEALGGVAVGGLMGRHPGGLVEVRIPTLAVLGRALPWGGSGWFRVYPYAVFRRGVERLLADGGDFLFYVHPWELDPGQPRPGQLGWRDRVRQYHGLAHTEAKLRRFLGDFAVEPIADAVQRRLETDAARRTAA